MTQKTSPVRHSSHFDLQEREWTYQQLCSAACSLRDHLLKEGLCPSRGASWIMKASFFAKGEEFESILDTVNLLYDGVMNDARLQD